MSRLIVPAPTEGVRIDSVSNGWVLTFQNDDRAMVGVRYVASSPYELSELIKEWAEGMQPVDNSGCMQGDSQ